MLEAQIRAAYCRQAQRAGHLTFVLHGSAYSGPGRPDTLTFLPGGRYVAIEFKRADGVLGPLQDYYAQRLRELGGCAFVARSAPLALRAVALYKGGTMPYDTNLELDEEQLAKLELLQKAKLFPDDFTDEPRPDYASITAQLARLNEKIDRLLETT